METKQNHPIFFLLIFLSLASSLSAQTAKSFPVQQWIVPKGTFIKGQDRFYAAVGDIGLSNNSNSIHIINPVWGTVEKTLKLGFNPQHICSSLNEQFIYLVVDGPHTIKKINSISHEVELVVPIPFNRRVIDITPVPGVADQILVTSMSYQRDTTFLELLIGNKFHPTKIVAPNPEYINNFGFANDSTLIIWQTNQMHKLRINSKGISIAETLVGILLNFGDQGIVAGNKVVTRTGRVIGFSGPELKEEPSIDPFYFMVGNDYNSDVFYAMKPVGDSFSSKKIRFFRFKKSDISIESSWEADFTLNNNGHTENYQLYITGKDRLIFTFWGNSHIAWNCTPAIPAPKIEQGIDVKACLNQLPVKLTVKDQGAAELLWSNGSTRDTLVVNETGDFAAKFTDKNGCQTAFSEVSKVSHYLPAEIRSVSTEMGNGLSFTICRKAKINLKATAYYENGQKWFWSTGDTTQTIRAAAGTYQVKMISADGCESAWSPNIIINEGKDSIPDRPVIKIANDDNEICNGEKAVFETRKGYNFYYWSLNPNNNFQNTITHTSNLNYSVSVTVRVATVENCPSETSSPLQIKFSSAPAKPTITLQGDKVFSSNTSSIHQWYINDVLIEGSTGTSIPVQGGGFYAAKVFDGRCNSDFSNYVSVNGKVTATDEAQKPELNIYPNPVQDLLHIDFPVAIRDAQKQVQIYSLDGKLMPESKLTSSNGPQTTLQTQQLNQGLYLLNVRIEAQQYWYKFVKN